MVFFTCSYCGESVKKPSVAKHYQTKCRNQIPFLTCVDCLKDFKGNDYEGHTKCFTEEEKYSAKGFVPKSSSNKGEKKQKAWSECVQGLLHSGEVKDDEKNFLQSIIKFDNIPRKKVKFINFISTTARPYANNKKLIDRVWEKLENYFKEVNSGNQQKEDVNESEEKTSSKDMKRKHDEIANDNVNENEKVSETIPEKNEVKKKKKKKHSTEEETTESVPEVVAEDKKSKKSKTCEAKKLNETEEPQSKKSKKSKKSKIEGNINGMENMEVDDKENVKDKKSLDTGNSTEKNGQEVDGIGDNVSFNWNDIILDVLSKNAKDNKITLKKLQKKVLKKYCKTFQCETTEKIIKKFMKKLNKVSNLTLNGEYVCFSK